MKTALRILGSIKIKMSAVLRRNATRPQIDKSVAYLFGGMTFFRSADSPNRTQFLNYAICELNGRASIKKKEKKRSSGLSRHP